MMQGMIALPLVQCCAPLAEPGLTEDEAGELYATDIRSGQLLRVVASRS